MSNEIFTEIYEKNSWSCPETRSGWGSALENTQRVVEIIENIIDRYNVQSVLDIGCGEFNWQKEIENLPLYAGVDVVPELILENIRKYKENPNILFLSLNSKSTVIPLSNFDLIICRDVLVHLSFNEIKEMLRGIKKSQRPDTLLLLTTFPNTVENVDIPTGKWRPLNMNKPPFNLPYPAQVYFENYRSEAYGDKSLGLWYVRDIPEGL